MLRSVGMSNFDLEEIKRFYDELDEIWPESEKWYIKENQEIRKYLTNIDWPLDSYVLNAGSGGNNYGLQYNFHHVDVSDNHMQDNPDFTRASIEQLPFEDETFDHCICVGSVLNYCDAIAAISELSRVLKTNGEIILEFENSWSYQHRGAQSYGNSAGIITMVLRNKQHTHWLYSEKYISALCLQYKLKIVQKKRYHILSSLILNLSKNENKSAKYICFDNLARLIPFVSRHGNNIIFRLKIL
jgi:ubiquinone/menaquinone biosynthesis C-methylase UbiE